MGMPKGSSGGLTLFSLSFAFDGKGHWVNWVFFTQQSQFIGTMCLMSPAIASGLKALAARMRTSRLIHCRVVG